MCSYPTPLGSETPKSTGKLNLTYQQKSGDVTDDDRNNGIILRVTKDGEVIDPATNAVLGKSDKKSRSRCCLGGGPEMYVGTSDQIRRQDEDGDHVTIKTKAQGDRAKFKLIKGDKGKEIGLMKGSHGTKFSVKLGGTKVANIKWKKKILDATGKFEIEIIKSGVDIAFLCLLCLAIPNFNIGHSRTNTVYNW